MEQEITYHTCSKCGEEKPLTKEYFTWRKDIKNFRKQCRKCLNKRSRLYNKQSTFIPNEKKCPCCKETKSSNDFLSNVARWDNLSVYCKECDYINFRVGGKYHSYEIKRNDKRKKDPEYIEYHKNYRNDPINKERRRKLLPKYHKYKYQTDPLYRIKKIIYKRLWNALQRKGWGKTSKTQDYLKCDYQTFKQHIQSQFTEGMSWYNQSEWHYDHYYPVSLAQTEEDMYIFNHYTNFRPLWAKDNLTKSNKVPDGFEEWYDMMRKKIL